MIKYNLVGLGCYTFSIGDGSTASVSLRANDDSETRTDACTGNGPIDAAIGAIERITKTGGKLQSLEIHSATKGADAAGMVRLTVEFPDGSSVSGEAKSTDIVLASAQAYLVCVNERLTLG